MIDPEVAALDAQINHIAERWLQPGGHTPWKDRQLEAMADLIVKRRVLAAEKDHAQCEKLL